nr:hypothetical protein Iba_chr14aCG7570 [Ipomoea batatas]GMD87126.1 hypothetical protein Iba_chr14bCG12720 [Ipomoea batatas]
MYWRTLCNEAVNWDAGRVNEAPIVRNDTKVVRTILASTFGGRSSNLHKVYRSDLYYLWSMENRAYVNMGLVCKK